MKGRASLRESTVTKAMVSDMTGATTKDRLRLLLLVATAALTFVAIQSGQGHAAGLMKIAGEVESGGWATLVAADPTEANLDGAYFRLGWSWLLLESCWLAAGRTSPRGSLIRR